LNLKSTFFDEKWDSIYAFKSRYPQVLLDGKVISVTKNYSKRQAKELLERYFNEMREIAKELDYWKHHLHEHLNHYKRDLNLNTRHTANLEGVLDVFDVYCKTQEEFNEWCNWIKDRMTAYDKMSKGQQVVFEEVEVEEEKVTASPEEAVYALLKEEEEIEEFHELYEHTIAKMIQKGELYRVRPGYVRLL
jgi:hypothetical protein